MESTRLNKIGRLIQKELGDIFQKQTQGMPGILISVSAVRVSPDLGVANAYLPKKGESYWNRSVQIPKRSVSIWVNV